jgi:hypothetical protein
MLVSWIISNNESAPRFYQDVINYYKQSSNSFPSTSRSPVLPQILTQLSPSSRRSPAPAQADGSAPLVSSLANNLQAPATSRRLPIASLAFPRWKPREKVRETTSRLMLTQRFADFYSPATTGEGQGDHLQAHACPARRRRQCS